MENFFKGPKLTKISPNKTYAGVIGGFFIFDLAGLNYLEFSSKFQEVLNIEIIFGLLY